MARLSCLLRKASWWTPFVVLASLIQTAHATSCQAEHIDETVTVQQVYDGDTVLLTDQRRVRFIGINTPERGRNGQKDEPVYAEARKQLLAMLTRHNMRIQLQFGQDKYDRYQRLLAHPFLPDGKNLSAELLQRGLGFVVAIPPNLGLHDCYIQSEQFAQKQKRQIWNHAYFKPRNINELRQRDAGYRRIQGIVRHVGQSRGSIWINFDNDVALRINRVNLKHFNYEIKQLTGKRIEARGWLTYRKEKYMMNIMHPSSIIIQP